MNKGINRQANDTDDLLHHNLVACREIARRGGKLSAGAVITHMGITPEMLETNYRMMRQVIRQYPRLFMELDFELLCPIPGSLAFDYLRRPGMARARADVLGLNVDDRELEALHSKYRDRDDPDPQELSRDFIRGCCPDITVDMAHDYLQKTRQLAKDEGIAYDCSNIGEPRLREPRPPRQKSGLLYSRLAPRSRFDSQRVKNVDRLPALHQRRPAPGRRCGRLRRAAAHVRGARRARDPDGERPHGAGRRSQRPRRALLHNCTQFVEAMFATAKIGAVFVPINFRLVAREVGALLDACGPKVLLAGEGFADLLATIEGRPNFPRSRIRVDDRLPAEANPDPADPYEAWLAAQPADEPREVVLPGAVQMLLHSSGTTGLPKGIIFTHATTFASSTAKIIDFGLTEKDTVVVFGPLFMRARCWISHCRCCCGAGASRWARRGNSTRRSCWQPSPPSAARWCKSTRRCSGAS
jgi:hypothetical protein